MRKLAGITIFLLILYVGLLLANPGARSLQNHFYLEQRIGMYGIISLAAGLLIITGGIDLSIGSVVGLCATLMAIFVQDHHMNPLPAGLLVVLIGMVIGLFHGVLVTKVGVQPFIATLCGLFIYRGMARWIANGEQKGLGNEYGSLKDFLNGAIIGVPTYLVIFAGLALVAAVFLHMSVYGRYFYAIGSNERAARFSGINTTRYRILAYVACSGLTALFSVFYLMKTNSAQPSSTGNFFELYAIAGAVLGGCSLRGGEGTVIGVFIGTAIIWLLPNMVNMWGVPSELEQSVIGVALLIGAILDELLRRKGRH